MADYVSEAIVFILDASRSMFRTDYSPNRLDACKQGILEFIQKRTANDSQVGASTTFGLVVIKDTAEKIFDFTDGAKYDQIANYFRNLKCSGASALGEGIGLAIKILIEDLRTNGARIPKILVLSDGKSTQAKVDPQKMATLAQQLSMHIDTIRIGEVEHFNILKVLSDTTEGKYNYANNAQIILSQMSELAVTNFAPPGSTYQKGKVKIPSKILKKIASPLLTEEEMKAGSQDQKELIARLRGTKLFEKCSICFQSNDPTSKVSFSISGRYCPNCAQPMHVSCAGMWAKNQDKEGDGTVFRCVHCLYLLKIPIAVQTAAKMHQDLKKEMKSTAAVDASKNPQTCMVAPIQAKILGESALYTACPVCADIFEEEEAVITCGNPRCNAIYHLRCYEKLEDCLCKTCGMKLIRNY